MCDRRRVEKSKGCVVYYASPIILVRGRGRAGEEDDITLPSLCEGEGGIHGRQNKTGGQTGRQTTRDTNADADADADADAADSDRDGPTYSRL